MGKPTYRFVAAVSVHLFRSAVPIQDPVVGVADENAIEAKVEQEFAIQLLNRIVEPFALSRTRRSHFGTFSKEVLRGESL